ncbi:MAG TPA: deoxynucleoside kinase [Steroidobacteraceae bacterium]
MDFCGIDGAGKSSIIDGLLHSPLGASITAVEKCDVKACRNALLAQLGFSDKRDFIHGQSGQLYALAGLFDYLTYSCGRVLDREGLVLRDRCSCCFEAFCWAVSFETGMMAERMFRDFPRADVIIYVEADPAECMSRILRRDNGRALDESLELLKRFVAGYERVLDHTANVFRITNSCLTDAVRSCEALIRTKYPQIAD